jgi:hypothetical protein
MTSSTRTFFVVSLGALVGAAVLHLLFLLGSPRAWAAMVHLTLFGWVTGMIFAVNYHTMPVFAARDFPYPRLIHAHAASFTLGVALASLALVLGSGSVLVVGLLLELLASLLFVANTMLLFLRGTKRPHGAAPPPFPEQTAVDRLGTQATKLAALCLPLALLLLLLTHLVWVGSTWWLAAEHLATLGWMMLMIGGVAYHILPRFSGQPTRGPDWARAHLLCHAAALALMVAALGFGWTQLFVLGGSLMALALGLFAWTLWPSVQVVQARLVTPTLNGRSVKP